MGDKTATPAKMLPEVDEFVIATITRITGYGAYATLDEYEQMDGFLHISEISSSWVKNIRDYVREKEKVVLKVLRVDRERKQIDLSLRRVSGSQRQDKLLEWKRRRKAEFILQVASEKLGVDPKTFITEVSSKLEEKFDNVYLGLEELAEKGEDLSSRLKLPEEWVAAVTEVAQQKIKLPRVKVKGILNLTCSTPDGIDSVKAVLLKAKSLKRPRKVKVDVYTIGAPLYVVEVTAKNYKDAEKTMEEIAEFAPAEIKRLGGEGELRREG